MAQVGGFRPGAGRPVGGLSEARRLLNQAIRLGLAYAVRDSGHVGTDDELAAAGAAEIVRQMVRNGRGDEVLQLWARIAPSDDPRGNGAAVANDSPLAAALGRMPGADGAPFAHLPGAVMAQDGASAGDAGQLAADSQSAGVAGEGPAGQDRQDSGPCIGEVLLPGQLVLGVDAAPCSLAPALTLPRVSVPAGLRGCVPAPAGVPGRAGAPTPPQPPAREVIHPHGSNFDFSVEDDCWSGDEDPDERDSSGDAAVVVGIARTGAAA